MSVKFVSVALLVTVLGSLTALAQTVSDVGGPKEQPPAGFAGMQYIDSRGCVFLRAGMGGSVKWVPRVGQDRKVLCGYPPTLGGGAAVAAAAPKPAPAAPAPKPVAMAAAIPEESYVPPPARVGKPIPTQAPAAAPLVVTVKPGQAVAAVEGRVGCPASAPKLQRLALTNGGTVLVCTPGDGVLGGMRPPVFADGAGVGAALDDAPASPVVAEAKPRPLGQAPAAKPGAARLAAAVTPPAGYVQAWKDDRLNPLRGVGSAAGQAAQDQVWTRKTPARLVGDTPRARREAAKERMGLAHAAPEGGTRLVVSTMSAPAGLFVQVGSFAVPANAAGAAARLTAAGLPVAQGRTKGLQVVMAGPFGTRAEAAAALGIARAQGFGDAFVR